jgi:hypothetical protein
MIASAGNDDDGDVAVDAATGGTTANCHVDTANMIESQECMILALPLVVRHTILLMSHGATKGLIAASVASETSPSLMGRACTFRHPRQP